VLRRGLCWSTVLWQSLRRGPQPNGLCVFVFSQTVFCFNEAKARFFCFNGAKVWFKAKLKREPDLTT
jgi:hypothetical protein